MAKYYSGEPFLSEFKAHPSCVLYCPKCNQAIQPGATVVGRDVHKAGEFDYTEVVHADCYEGQAPKADPVMAGTAVIGVLIDGKTVEQWLATRGQR